MIYNNRNCKCFSTFWIYLSCLASRPHPYPLVDRGCDCFGGVYRKSFRDSYSIRFPCGYSSIALPYLAVVSADDFFFLSFCLVSLDLSPIPTSVENARNNILPPSKRLVCLLYFEGACYLTIISNTLLRDNL